MTRKQMINKCLEQQIERGIIEVEDKDFLMKDYLKEMSKRDCESWYKSCFENN